MMITNKQIQTLRIEALAHGDQIQADLCDAALSGQDAARAECARVIADALTNALDRPISQVQLELEALKLGTDNQRERYHAQVLPEDELTALAREELFKVFGDTHRWRALKKSEVKHYHCLGDDGRHVEFETADIGELAHDEWENLKLIQQMAHLAQRHDWLVRSGGKVTVQGQTHWATCVTCQVEVCRSSAKVSIEWAGRTLTREYAL